MGEMLSPTEVCVVSDLDRQFTGEISREWGKLTEDDLTAINGRRDQLEGKIQERYGYAKDQARKEVDDWYSGQQW